MLIPWREPLLFVLNEPVIRRVNETAPLQRLRAQVGDPAPRQLGLTALQLERLAKQYQFTRLAALYPTRGDEARLRELAWLGSAFADATAPAPCDRDAVLREAALFNLAIALFDTVIDDSPAHSARLIQALHPERLIHRLERAGAGASLVEPGACRELLSLFDAALASMAARFAQNRPARRVLQSMIIRMYASETELQADRIAAKALPVAFYGVLPDGGARTDVALTFARLGQFVALLDDWKDLQDDLTHARANLWLSPRDGRGPFRARYLARASWSVLLFALRPSRVGALLSQHIEALLGSVVNADRDKLTACIALLLDGVDS